MTAPSPGPAPGGAAPGAGSGTAPAGELVVEGGAPLRGTVRVPGDKSVSHRALLLAALAEGTSKVSGRSRGADLEHTADAVRALGAGIRQEGPWEVVTGGRQRLGEPARSIDCGNSGTGVRLLAGLVAGLDGLFVLEGDASVASRPMDRVAQPLREMGAVVDGRMGGTRVPLVVRGGRLEGIEHAPAVASAQVKGAVLLAGLAARGETVIHERSATRAHSEELLALAGADLEVCSEGAGRRVTIRPGPLAPFELVVPGDPSQAAFWVVAACCVPGSEVVVESIYLGPARGGFLEVLHRMGADVEARRRGGGTVDLVARYGPLQGTDVTGEEVPGLVDEIPVLAVAAACAEGTTTFSGAAELRVKESDRIATTVAALVALGAKVEPRADGLVVHGGRLSAGSVDSAGDHRIAMAAAVAALVPSGRSVIGGWDAVATSYPAFRTDLDRLTERW